jgi:hypothetical protein
MIWRAGRLEPPVVAVGHSTAGLRRGPALLLVWSVTMQTATRPFHSTRSRDVATPIEEMLLDDMRQVGDPSADDTIARWLAKDPYRSDAAAIKGERAALTPLANNLVGFDQAPELSELLELLREREGPQRVSVNDDELALDQQEEALAEYLFTDHGLKILMILVFYSLPAAYAAVRGVPVLHSDSGGTGFLVKDVNRRLIETTQFVLEVLTAIKPTRTPRRGDPPHERAVASARRVRLLHAVVRAMILARPTTWDLQDRGTPVNQEDMAGTFLTFSWVVIDGMRRLRLRVSPEQERVFYDIWRQIAPSLGLDPSMVPETVDDAERLTKLIRERQVDGPIRRHEENRFGKLMTNALLEFLKGQLPWPLKYIKRLPASVIRFFLPTSPCDVATSIGVPRTYVLDELVRLWFFFEARITRFRVFDAMNRLVFKEWGRRDERAKGLLQFSRFFMRRFVIHLESRDRNEALEVKHRPKNIDLLGWDERWNFDQASFARRGVRIAVDRVRGRGRT